MLKNASRSREKARSHIYSYSQQTYRKAGQKSRISNKKPRLLRANKHVLSKVKVQNSELAQ